LLALFDAKVSPSNTASPIYLIVGGIALNLGRTPIF